MKMYECSEGSEEIDIRKEIEFLVLLKDDF